MKKLTGMRKKCWEDCVVSKLVLAFFLFRFRLFVADCCSFSCFDRPDSREPRPCFGPNPVIYRPTPRPNGRGSAFHVRRPTIAPALARIQLHVVSLLPLKYKNRTASRPRLAHLALLLVFHTPGVAVAVGPRKLPETGEQETTRRSPCP
jgi:hypothetical protein